MAMTILYLLATMQTGYITESDVQRLSYGLPNASFLPSLHLASPSFPSAHAHYSLESWISPTKNLMKLIFKQGEISSKKRMVLKLSAIFSSQMHLQVLLVWVITW